MKRFYTVILLFICILGLGNAQNFTWEPQESGVIETLNDVFFVNDQDGWVVGDKGVILHTTDGGGQWVKQTSGVSEKLLAVQFTSPLRGWIAGGTFSTILLKTINGGENWTGVDMAQVEGTILDLYFEDASHGWVMTLSGIYSTTDAAETWARESFSGNNSDGVSLNAIVGTSDSTAFACGKYNRSGSRAAVFENITSPEGLWVADAGALESSDEMRSLCFTDYYTGYAGGQNGKVYKMASDGINFNGPWELSIDTKTGGIIHSISFPSMDHGMFNTGIESSGKSYTLVYHTNNGGESWSSVPDSIPLLLTATLFAPDNENAWIVGSLGDIYRGLPKDPSSVPVNRTFQLGLTPNPFDDLIHIEAPGSFRGVYLRLFSFTGQLMRSEFLKELPDEYEMTGLASLTPGVYCIHLQSEDGQVYFTRKLVKY
jgi:photosystem II stability/assembly factor-like uncharacterized protein